MKKQHFHCAFATLFWLSQNLPSLSVRLFFQCHRANECIKNSCCGWWIYTVYMYLTVFKMFGENLFNWALPCLKSRAEGRYFKAKFLMKRQQCAWQEVTCMRNKARIKNPCKALGSIRKAPAALCVNSNKIHWRRGEPKAHRQLFRALCSAPPVFRDCQSINESEYRD